MFVDLFVKPRAPPTEVCSRVRRLGFRVGGFGFRVWGLGFGV